ncbi:uncharacterized protein LOC135132327 [Zophobas morio]|uniref:uncharacterized protein LOC135132327 n=1 Tax=Zophobas morio TaxID=2755281 RepID=UPI00308336EA
MDFTFYFVLALVNLAWCREEVCFRDISNIDTSCHPDYYWRDFKDRIPPDAIEGGMTASGTPIYVAQVYIYKIGLLPGMVFPNKPNAVTNAHGKKMESATDVKVLCSTNKNNFKWVPTKSEELNLLTNTHLVVGGKEGVELLYVGRALDDGSTVLGKIFKHNFPYRGLWVPSQAREANYLHYEILTYVCPTNKVIVNPE